MTEVEKGNQSRKTALINGARYLLVVLVIAAAVYYLWSNWDEVYPSLQTISVPSIIFSFVAVVAGIACSTMSWQVLVDDLGHPIGAGRGAQIFLVGQLGKYLPGTVWAYLLQLELGRKAGLARARVFAATLFSIAVAMVAALAAGALGLPEVVAEKPTLTWLYWLYIVLPLALVALHPRILNQLARFGFKLLRRPQPDHDVSMTTVVKSLLWALGTYVCYGTHLWLLARSAADLGIQAWLLCIGAMAMGMVAGLVAFILPSGAGVRELVIVAALAPLVGVGPAAAFAAVSRVIFTAADLTTAGGSAALAYFTRSRRGAYVGDPGLGEQHT